MVTDVSTGLRKLGADDLTLHRARFALRRLAAGADPVSGEAGHGDRVASLAFQVASRLGDVDPEAAYAAGVLHDVGKALLPFDPTTLCRPLSAPERAVVEEHPALGAAIVTAAGYSEEVILGVLYHHERIDGSGYPHALEGVEVPLIAQVIGAVDVFDALSSERCYKPAWSRPVVERYGDTHRGRWFLPRVWDAVVGLA